MKVEELIEQSKIAMSRAYSPYSRFKVGASLLTKEGKVILGSNIENASYSNTICSERCAISKAVSDGYKEFEMIAISTEANELAFPCGSCLQVISEFCDDDFKIILANSHSHKIYALKDLLPHPFRFI